jgi:hypothetical protein
MVPLSSTYNLPPVDKFNLISYLYEMKQRALMEAMQEQAHQAVQMYAQAAAFDHVITALSGGTFDVQKD